MIYFVRHGESEANLKKVFAGQKENSILTEKGREQAKDTAKELQTQGIKIDLIISSPLKRTIETAKIIAQNIGFDVSKIVTDDRIIEYDMGVLTGTPWNVVTSLEMTSAMNSEDPEKFYSRVHECVSELSKKSENILLVSHGGVGRMLQNIKQNKPKNLFYDMSLYKNASITKIDWIE